MATVQPNIKQAYTDSAGNPLVGGKVYTYAPGTTTPKATYSDAAGTVANPNPVVLDARGEALIYWNGLYKVELRDALNALISTVDNFGTSNAVSVVPFGNARGSYAQSTAYAVNDYVIAANGAAYLCILAYTSPLSGGDPSTDAVHWQVEVAATTALLQSAAAGGGADLIGYSAGNTPVAGTLGAHLTETYFASDLPWNVQPNVNSDQSVGMQAAFDFVKTRGGTLKFKPGYYLGRINFSGSYGQMVLDGQGAIFRPFANTQGEVFFANNNNGTPGNGSFNAVTVLFKNLYVYAQRIGTWSDTDPLGQCDYGVNFRSASAKWEDCFFQYGRIASYYGYYHQYGEFDSCLWGAAVYANTTVGCLLDGNTASEASNENRFYAPKFFSNKNGLIIKGGFKNRIYAATIQDTRAGGTAGIYLTTDASGLGADGTNIDGAYLEVNAVPGILVGVAPNTSINNAELLDAGTIGISTTHCYNLSLTDAAAYNNGRISINHPTANNDVARLTVRGGNVTPETNGLIHAGPTFIDISQPGLFAKPLGQNSTQSVPLQVVDFVGNKQAVLRTVVTTLFSITQQAFATSQMRYSLVEIQLFAVDDTNATSQFGYSSRIQRAYLFISNNTSGNPQAFLSGSIDGADLGVSTTFTAPGPFTLSTSVSGQVVTISAVYAGAGTSPATTGQVSVGYRVMGIGGNPITLTRL